MNQQVEVLFSQTNDLGLILLLLVNLLNLLVID